VSLRPPSNPPQPAPPDWSAIRNRASTFPPAAFDFIRDGLAHAVEKLSEAQAQAAVPESEAFIACAPKKSGNTGTSSSGSRHITGQQLCLGLRDMARDRYGMLALTVLHRWGVRSTEDFGVMVYALIDRGEMRSSHDDRFEDFVGQYEFAEAFNAGATV
jgi:uncharacterized repeat protein (TIGR04138 family)